MSTCIKPIKLLRLVDLIEEISAPYHQFSLSLMDQQDITLCTYFRSQLTPHPQIALYEGDGSLGGFFRALGTALQQREYDIVHVHTPQLGCLFLMANLLRLNKLTSRTVYTAHNSYPNYKLRNRLLLIPIFAFFRRVVCCSNASCGSFPALYRWLAGDRLCVVQNGLDIDRVDRAIQNRRGDSRPSGFVVMTVGRLIDLKNPMSVLQAFRQIQAQEDRLVFIGDGYLREALLSKSRALGLAAQVEVTGVISRDKVYQEMLGADVFISASYGEGLPVAVLEAMACRRPVLLSDIAPHREIARGADFIPLIPPGNTAAFAQEIKRFKQMSASQRAEIGERCRKLVETRFSLVDMYRGYNRIYSRVIGGENR